MKILLYGEYWEGTHIDSISIALCSKDIPNVIFNFHEYLNYTTSSSIINKTLRRVFYYINELRINNYFLKVVYQEKPTAILISKGLNIYPKTLIKIKKLGITICNWNPDDFFNLKNSSVHLRRSFKLYDIVFSSRKHLFKEYYANGFNRMIYLDWYYIPWLHKPHNISKLFRKISFIGTRSSRREKIIESINDSFIIEIWGTGWDFSRLKSKPNIHIKNKFLFQKDFPQIISNSLVNLNILTIENRDLTNLKIFEIVASGGLILTEDNTQTREILGNSAFYYNENNLNTVLKEIFEMDDDELVSRKKSLVDKVINSENSINDRVSELLIYLK